ncbi:hypothetical protein EB155_07895 [archaeon]|nr:hypothetical protein [archaeon]
MRKLIYQVAIGPKTQLYKHCTGSVQHYADKIGADYYLQTQPILRITPNPFLNQREGKTGGWKKHGYMPIFEKENVFDLFAKYDKCCVIDADVYVRPDAPDIFDQLADDRAVASVYECDLPINNHYAEKIRSYSLMISLLKDVVKSWPVQQRTGYDFFNSGVMLYNSKLMLNALGGMNSKQFLQQPMLDNLINGVGPFKWQSDQITLNYWFKKKRIEVQRLDWRFNALYSTISEQDLSKAYFIHFFLKDHLPEKGENIEQLVELLG